MRTTPSRAPEVAMCSYCPIVPGELEHDFSSAFDLRAAQHHCWRYSPMYGAYILLHNMASPGFSFG